MLLTAPDGTVPATLSSILRGNAIHAGESVQERNQVDIKLHFPLIARLSFEVARKRFMLANLQLLEEFRRFATVLEELSARHFSRNRSRNFLDRCER